VRSVVLSPGVITLGATEETDLALISSPELTEPPDCKIILTFGALDLDGGHCPRTLLLFIHDHNLLFLALQRVVNFFVIIDNPDITAFPAFQLAPDDISILLHSGQNIGIACASKGD
jgi:hypothetical protein